MVVSPFIAIDWGTTNRRAYRVEDGRIAATLRSPQGVSTTPADAYPHELAAIRAELGDLPVLMAGMVGSTIGWRVAPYVAVPAGIGEIAAALTRIDDRTAIVPGLSFTDGTQGDVMRGEEVQLLGAALAGQVPADALLCQPGTHCKWVELRGNKVTAFTTAMTGELFALLRGGGVLAPQLTAPVAAGDAFRDGVREGSKRDLAASLFGIRAAHVLGLRDESQAASYASGVLIGNDVAVRIDGGRDVHLVADGDLATLYATAIETLGGRALVSGCEAAFIAGITQIRKLSA
ncbi:MULTISPECIES: 2-dehydro-3-deoxygalactonokinase [unclassified Sphingomonas]|uniref:2-dehydro-3-deoxygalactonokinase n=1 Tax=unclassified Sphingomonas TaxID=196159 RepID=UPI0007006B4D|nr:MULTISPECIES: 2-dehydro-3-deoxygalactonokinase [unclassified Sphingomonas]KQM26340.1 2-oxo-3-deoxygalactonate kinase [Sphingomonas sp. Leaf9]KQM42750.1 2-oxo-3-deoxygalactonate kinase [Sphingomonas sp. Leaf11]